MKTTLQYFNDVELKEFEDIPLKEFEDIKLKGFEDVELKTIDIKINSAENVMIKKQSKNDG